MGEFTLLKGLKDVNVSTYIAPSNIVLNAGIRAPPRNIPIITSPSIVVHSLLKHKKKIIISTKYEYMYVAFHNKEDIFNP